MQFASLTSEFVPLVKSGRLRLLATMGEDRSPTFPQVHTMKKTGYDFVTDAVYAIVDPAQMSTNLENKLGKALTIASKDKQYLKTISKMDLVTVYYSGKSFERFLRVNWGVINKHLVSTGLIKKAATPLE